MPGTILFVYGTLKRGMSNHHRLAGATYLGPARTRPLYRLLDLGWHPGLVQDAASGAAIEGELWELDEQSLPALDVYEGVPDCFDRGAIELEGSAGEVQAYFYQGDPAGKRDCGVNWRPS